jgi:hypothetical protein
MTMTRYWKPRTLKDHAGFCRQAAVSCFHRRRDYPVGSDERARLMDEARRFLLWHRVASIELTFVNSMEITCARFVVV